jgi:hypothetical protein
LVVAVCPGGGFVVGVVVGEAAVEDADEAVAEGSEGFVVGVALEAAVVVERSASGAVVERAEGPLVDGIGEAGGADEAGEGNVAGA